MNKPETKELIRGVENQEIVVSQKSREDWFQKAGSDRHC